MPILSSGSNVTLTVAAGQILTVQSDAATFDFENPVGTRVGEYACDSVFGPFASSGSVKITSVQGPVYYELANRPVGQSTPFDPSSVAITGGAIGKAVQVGDRSVAHLGFLRKGWSIANYGLQGIDTSVGLSYSASTNYISATVGGTMGRMWWPWLSRTTARMSATIKVTKGTAASISLFGLAFAAAGSDPGASYTGCEAGYVQGTGLVLYRNNAAAAVLLADASLTDGAEYQVHWIIDDLWNPAASSPATYLVQVRLLDSTGAEVQTAQVTPQRSFDPVRGVLIARTNVAAGGIKNLWVAQNGAGQVGVQGIVQASFYGTPTNNDQFHLRLPAQPNGKLVIAFHGRGLSLFQMAYQAAQYAPVWSELERMGYTILFPNMNGDTWASDASLTLLAQMKAAVCAELKLDPAVYLWGYSMGGMMALKAVQRQTFGANNVSAIYLAAPVCDVEAVYTANPSFTEIGTIYPTPALLAANNPIKGSMANFAGVPMLFVAATDDTTVAKTANTDALVALLAGITTTTVVSTTGGHGSSNLHRAAETVGVFELV